MAKLGVFLFLFTFCVIGALAQSNKKNDCTSKPATGVCRSYEERWYYNGKKCETFVYGGCPVRSNNNNYETYEECALACDPVVYVGGDGDAL